MEGSKMSSLPGHTSYLLRGKAHSATIGPEATEEIADDQGSMAQAGSARERSWITEADRRELDDEVMTSLIVVDSREGHAT